MAKKAPVAEKAPAKKVLSEADKKARKKRALEIKKQQLALEAAELEDDSD